MHLFDLLDHCLGLKQFGGFFISFIWTFGFDNLYSVCEDEANPLSLWLCAKQRSGCLIRVNRYPIASMRLFLVEFVCIFFMYY